MERELESIFAYLNAVSDFALPRYKELPGAPLYMEQVLSFINDALSSLRPEEAKPLTSFMVNNYVKARMIDEPEKKKYSRDQIGYLIAISLMKTTVSMSDMETFLKLDKGVSANKEVLYRFWSEMETSILSEAAKKTHSRVENIQKRYRNDLSRVSQEKAEANARDALGLIAMRLAIQAQANKLLSDYIIGTIGKTMDDEAKDTTPKKKSPKNKTAKKRRTK